MDLYQRLYSTLFNSITDALEEMEAWNFGRAAEMLKEAQKKTEELFLDSEEKRENAGTGETTL